MFKLDDSHACAQPKNEGSSEPACLALITKWYHNHATGKCEEFFYNGCGGNANNFDTEEKCKETCDEWHEKHKDHHHGHSHADHGDCHHDHDHSKHDHSHHH